MTSRRFLCFTVIAVLCVFAACSGWRRSAARSLVPPPPDSCLRAIVQPQPSEPEAVVKAREARANAILGKMTVEEKVGQLFITGIGGLNNEISPEVFPTEINEAQIKNIKKYNIGGVIFFGGNILNDAQIKKYINDLQASAKTPLFISVDEEGGIVSRLGSNPDISVTPLPKMIELGNAGDIVTALHSAQTLGMELHRLGFNLNFAPVADVLTNPLNTVIREKGRAFGIEPEIACAMVPEFVKGLQEYEVSSTIKHFPGHGDTVADTHAGRVFSHSDMQRLRTVELLPFRAGIQAGADFVMVAHISLPNVTRSDEPASMSKYIVTDLLKGELGFKGLVITDDMYMDAVRAHYPLGEAAARSINAGVDVIISKLLFEEGYNGVLSAVKKGEITKERLDDAVKKILFIKLKRGVIK